MVAYRRVDGFKLPADWLPVHRDQLRAQRSVTSMGELYLFLITSHRHQNLCIFESYGAVQMLLL